MSCLQGICALMLMPLPCHLFCFSNFYNHLTFLNILSRVRYYLLLDSENKIAKVQKLPIVKSAQTAWITCSAQGEKFIFV